MLIENVSLKEKYTKSLNEALLSKWHPIIEGVKSVYPNYDDIETINLAILCENTQEQINRYKRSISETTQTGISDTVTGDVGPYIRHAFEMIAGLMPNLVAPEVVSVQALKQKIGQIFFLKYVYGSTKGRVTKGDVAFGPYEIASNPNYSSQTVDQEILDTEGTETTYSVSLQYGPVLAGTCTITAGNITVTDNGNGAFSATGLTGTINYDSGAIALTFTTAPASQIDATYQYNLAYAPSEAPEFDLKVDQRIVVAQPRKLRARYSFDAAYDIEKQWGINMDAKLLEASVTEIKHEIDQEILNDLIRQAGLSISWDMTKPVGVSLEEHYKSFLATLTAGSNLIYKATKRATGNVLVAGINAATVVETLPGFVPTPGVSDKVGAYVDGTVKGQVKVIKNPWFGDDDFLIAFKGDNFLDAGYVYAPYLPVFATQIVMLDDFVGRRGFGSWYAKAMLNPNYYVKGTITHSTSGVQVFNTNDTPVYTKAAV